MNTWSEKIWQDLEICKMIYPLDLWMFSLIFNAVYVDKYVFISSSNSIIKYISTTYCLLWFQTGLAQISPYVKYVSMLLCSNKSLYNGM